MTGAEFIHHGQPEKGQPSARHLYPHEIPALYARCVQGLRVRDCRVRSGGPGDWSGRPALLEDCPGAVVELDAE